MSLHADFKYPASQWPNEEGMFTDTYSFQDEDGDPVTPTAATWSLLDENQQPIGSLLDTAISPLSTSFTLVLSGDDLIIGDQGQKRWIVLKFTYNSSLGSGLKATWSYYLEINDKAGIT